MALDFGQTARQMMSAMGDLSTTARSRRQRFADTLDRASAVTSDDAAQRTASAGQPPLHRGAHRSRGVCWIASRRLRHPRNRLDGGVG